jgi:hypothetical protein
MEKLVVFVPGRLGNPLNGPHGHWSKHARWAKQWRERTHLAWLEKYQRRGDLVPTVPKLIRFRAHTWNAVDDDALSAMCKPVRDALRDIGLIHDDSPGSGHVFVYGQVIERSHRGVQITVEPLESTVADSGLGQ